MTNKELANLLLKSPQVSNEAVVVIVSTAQTKTHAVTGVDKEGRITAKP